MNSRIQVNGLKDMRIFKHLLQRGLAAWLVLLAAIFMVTLAPQARAEAVYGITVNGIFSVDAATGGPAIQLVTFASALPNAATLASRPGDGMLFYLDSQGANPNLWRWDPVNPTSLPVLVGSPGAATSGIIRMGFDENGRLMAMNSGLGTLLWELDQNSGAIVNTIPVSGDGDGNITGGGDMCLHPISNVQYMVTQTNLYTLNSAGVLTLLGSISGLPAIATGCTFTHDGTLITSPGTTLYSVNISSLTATAMPAATGAAAFGDLASSPTLLADLRVTKTSSSPTPGTTASFTVTVTNDGPNIAPDVRLLDLLPAGLTLTSANTSQGTYANTAVAGYPAGTWRVGSLAVGASATLTINTNVTGTTAITNWAQVSYTALFDPDSTPGSVVPPAVAQDDQASVTITPSPDLRMVKVANGSFSLNTNATYTLTVNNTLGGVTTGTNTYTVTDVLPAGLTFISATGTGWACANAAATVTCTSSSAIAAGATSANPIILTVTPTAAASPSVNNTATVSGGGEPASNNGNNSSTVTTSVCSTPSCIDLKVNKTLSTASLTVGVNTSVYTLSVSNIGAAATSALYTLTDTLPTGLTLNAAPTAGAGWTCAANTPSPGDNIAGSGRVVCTSSTVIAAAGTSTTVTFPVNVLGTAVPSVTNTASVAGGGEPVELNTNNSTSLTTPVLAFDLTMTKIKTTAANFVLGVNTATYTLTVNNIGGAPTTGTYTLTDTLPTGMTLNAAPTTGGGWTCAANTPTTGDNAVGGGRVVCTRSTVINAGNSSSTVVFPVNVAAAAAPSVTNTASVSNPNESANLLGNNSSTVTSLVDAPNLVVNKSHTGDFTVGTNGVYTIVVTNLGALTTSTADVVVTDTLPAGLTFVSGAGTGWNACTAVGQVVTCVLPLATAIAPGTSAAPILLTVGVGATAAGASPVTNSVSVSGGNEPPNNATNNSEIDLTKVFYSPVLTKAFSPTSIASGGTSTLTLTITNPAGNTTSLAGLGVVDFLPTGMTVAAIPAFSNTCGGTNPSGTAQGNTSVSLTGGATGPAGSSCVISVNVTSITVGANVNTTAKVTSTNSGSGNVATATLTVTSPASPTLTMVSTPDPVGVNMPVKLTYTINNSAAANTGLGFTHNFPIVNNAQMVWQSTVSNTCTAGAGALANPAGAALVAGTSTGIRLSGYGPAASAVCTIVITATVDAVGTVTTINATPGISGLTGTALLVSTVNDTFNVVATTLTKTFNPTVVAPSAASLLTFTITNGTGNPTQGGTAPINNLLAFTETLPAGLVVASAPTAAQCNGTVAATVGTGAITFSGGTLSATQASCTIVVSVSSPTSGVYNNLPANVTGYASNIVNSATATLNVGAPILSFRKTVADISDPFNLLTNPKNIPGGVVEYSLRVTNSGQGTVDISTLFISDPIPTNTELFVGDLATPLGPIAFVQGTPTSNLSWTFTALNSTSDDVDFSNDGGLTWTYVPTPPYDPAVNRIRLNPKGVMAAASGGNNPFIELKFRVRIR